MNKKHLIWPFSTPGFPFSFHHVILHMSASLTVLYLNLAYKLNNLLLWQAGLMYVYNNSKTVNYHKGLVFNSCSWHLFLFFLSFFFVFLLPLPLLFLCKVIIYAGHFEYYFCQFPCLGATLFYQFITITISWVWILVSHIHGLSLSLLLVCPTLRIAVTVYREVQKYERSRNQFLYFFWEALENNEML